MTPPDSNGFYTAHELKNHPLAKKLKKKLEQAAKTKHVKAQAAKKKKKKPKKKSASQPHASSTDPLKGILAKDDKYAQNGHDYLEGDAGRHTVYLNFDLKYARLSGLPDDVLQAFKFPSAANPQNFNPSAKDIAPVAKGKKPKPAGQAYPYVWEAHHILPGSAFYYHTPINDPDEEPTPCFTPAQRRLILQSDYNLNHGHNIIFLPDECWAVPIHSLLQHPGDHPVYTQLVMKGMKEISERIEKLKNKSHDEIKGALFKELQQLENRYWKFIVNLSKEVVTGLVAGLKIDRPWVTFQTKDKKNPTIYEWGALF
jgi:hypothetical protein